MADDPNIVTPEGDRRTATPGDVPDQLRRRYLTEGRGSRGLGFYADVRSEAPAFRDHGGRLTTERNDPHVVRDLVAIARHRGWTAIIVRGDREFRREVWLTARAAGLEVRGHRPSARDRQHEDRRRGAPGARPTTLSDRERLRVVETVVRNRVVEPSEQARILASARSRLARWLAPAGPPDREHRR